MQTEMKLKKVSNPYSIILGLLAGLLVIQFLVRQKFPEESETLGYIILAVAVLSVLFKAFANLLASLWMGLGLLLGKINGLVLLTLVYLFLLTPLAWLKKIFSSSPNFNMLKQGNSRFIDRNHTFSEEDFQRPW